MLRWEESTQALVGSQKRGKLLRADKYPSKIYREKALAK